MPTKTESSSLISYARWLEGIPLSPTTGWRFAKRGWVRTTNIAGRLYITAAERKRFEDRATAGEFARKPAGAAGPSFHRAV